MSSGHQLPDLGWWCLSPEFIVCCGWVGQRPVVLRHHSRAPVPSWAASASYPHYEWADLTLQPFGSLRAGVSPLSLVGVVGVVVWWLTCVLYFGGLWVGGDGVV